MINTDILLKDLISRKVLGSSVAYTPEGIKIVDFISQYIKKFGVLDTSDPQKALTTEQSGHYHVMVIDQNNKSKPVHFQFEHDNFMLYGTSDELGTLEANFDSKTGEPKFVDITKGLPDKGLVYTTATPEGFRTSYYTATEQGFRELGVSEGIMPEMVEFRKEQIDGDLYFAAYMNHEAEVAKRIDSRTR